ncbi:hypothetical protein BDV18DRAFT_132778 [Aspergillus unguis]
MSDSPARVKTCQTCATAKIRCLRSVDSPVCDRCLRLNKPCYFRPARLRQTWTRKETRLESLEKRLDQLLEQRPSDNRRHDEREGDVIDRGLLSPDDAAALLDHFLQFMMPHFPFVALPSDTVADQLRVEKPFLFLVILSVSVIDDRLLKRTLDEEVKAIVAERTVLTRETPSFETLQGILLILAWSQHQVQQRFRPRDLSTYLHLAIAIVVDLELDRPADLHRRGHRIALNQAGEETQPRSMSRAEQRASIGCSFLCSCFAIITQRRCTFPWNHHLEAFAFGLAQDPEFPSDRFIIDLVRLQRIFEQMDRISTDPDAGQSTMSGRNFQQSFRVFRAQLQDYSDQLEAALPTNFLLASYLWTVNLYLCQVTLFDKKPQSQLPSSFQSEILCHGLAVAKNFFDLLTRISPGTERFFSYSEWLQSGFNTVISCKLTLMAVSDETLRRNYPQVQALCDDLDMVRMLKVCIDRQIASHPSPGSQKTGFDYTGWLKFAQAWFHKNYDPHVSKARTTNHVPSHKSASYVYEPQQAAFSINAATDGLNMPVSIADEPFPWTSYPDLSMADNPLAGWMDFGMPINWPS